MIYLLGKVYLFSSKIFVGHSIILSGILMESASAQWKIRWPLNFIIIILILITTAIHRNRMDWIPAHNRISFQPILLLYLIINLFFLFLFTWFLATSIRSLCRLNIILTLIVIIRMRCHRRRSFVLLFFFKQPLALRRIMRTPCTSFSLFPLPT